MVQELYGRCKGAEPGAWDERDARLRALLRHVGEGVVVRSPFYCECGNIGDRAFVKGDAVVLDVAPVTIGAAGSSLRGPAAHRDASDRDRRRRRRNPPRS